MRKFKFTIVIESSDNIDKVLELFLKYKEQVIRDIDANKILSVEEIL